MCNSFLDGIASVGGGFGDLGWWEGIDRVFLAVFEEIIFGRLGKGTANAEGAKDAKVRGGVGGAEITSPNS
jgi:hypothetical protein